MPERPHRLYGDPLDYERKLGRVMERLGADGTRFDYSRAEAWVEFRYKGQIYRFEHTVKKAQDRGVKMWFGSDCFCQLVLALEDLARMVERGIYDLSQWIEGMKYLPSGSGLAPCLRVLQFDRIPAGPDEVRSRFAQLVRQAHPDGGADPDVAAERISALKVARDEAMSLMEGDGSS